MDEPHDIGQQPNALRAAEAVLVAQGGGKAVVAGAHLCQQRVDGIAWRQLEHEEQHDEDDGDARQAGGEAPYREPYEPMDHVASQVSCQLLAGQRGMLWSLRTLTFTAETMFCSSAIRTGISVLAMIARRL